MEEYWTNKTGEQWHREELILGRVCFSALRNFSLEVPLRGRGSPYTQLADAYHQAFTEQIARVSMAAKDRDEQAIRIVTRDEICDAPTVGLGYKVTGALLGYATWAYATHTQESGQAVDSEALRATLKNPEIRESILSWFADVPNQINSIREMYFGLKPGGYEHNRKIGFNPFVCTEDPETKELHIRMDPKLILPATREELDYWDSREMGEFERCPTHGHALSAIWDAMADDICDNLAYFEPEVSVGLRQATPVQ